MLGWSFLGFGIVIIFWGEGEWWILGELVVIFCRICGDLMWLICGERWLDGMLGVVVNMLDRGYVC